jgi:hypothetical protein
VGQGEAGTRILAALVPIETRGQGEHTGDADEPDDGAADLFLGAHQPHGFANGLLVDDLGRLLRGGEAGLQRDEREGEQ